MDEEMLTAAGRLRDLAVGLQGLHPRHRTSSANVSAGRNDGSTTLVLSNWAVCSAAMDRPLGHLATVDRWGRPHTSEALVVNLGSVGDPSIAPLASPFVLYTARRGCCRVLEMAR
jgi:hypothetical protein